MTSSTQLRRWGWAAMLFLMVSAVASAKAPGAIPSFASAITVNDDGSLSVQEDVQYQPDPKHPTARFHRLLTDNYYVGNGMRRVTPINVSPTASCNDQPISFRKYRKDNGILLEFRAGLPLAQRVAGANGRMRIRGVNDSEYGNGAVENDDLPQLDNTGDAPESNGSDATVTPSPQRHLDDFQYSYRIARLIDYHANSDEITCHVTGAGWELPIRSCSVTVALPAHIDPGSVHITGRFGKKRTLVPVTFDPATGLFTANAPWVVKTNEGLTLTLDFPPDAFPRPKPGTIWSQLRKDNPTLFHAPLELGILCVAYLLIWVLIGRNPRRGSIMPTALPPEKISPALAHYLLKGRSDPAVLMCALVNMATRGLLQIEEREHRYLLHRVIDDNLTLLDAQLQAMQTHPAHALSSEEKELAEILFSKRLNLFEFNDEFADDIRYMGKLLVERLKGRTEQVLLNSNIAFLTAGFIISSLLLIVLVIGEVPAFAWGERLRLGLGVLTMSVGVPLLTMYGWHLWQDIFSYRVVRAGFSKLILRYSIIGLAVLLIMWWSMSTASVALLAAALILAALNLLYTHVLKTPTLRGQRLLDQLAGFRAYLGGAAPPDAPAESLDLFIHCLPYALALDVQEQWAQRFQNRFDEHQLAAAMSWYDGLAWNGQDLVALANSLHNKMAPLMTTLTVRAKELRIY